MKKHRPRRPERWWIFSMAFLLFLRPLSQAGAEDWKELRDAAQRIRTISAEFVQEKHLKILSKPIISRGVFYYQAPNSLRWEYTSPVPSILLMHKGKTRRFVATKDGLVEASRSHPGGMQFILTEITRWLKGSFSENPSFNATLTKDGTILLTPKEKALSEMILRIELLLSETPGLINSVRVVESERSWTRLEFKNTRLNRHLNEALFLNIS